MLQEQRLENRQGCDERLLVQIVESDNPELVGTTLSCRTLDVSSGGLRVTTDKEVPIGCQLDLWIDNASRPGKFFLTSDVRWVSRCTQDPGFEIGVALHDGAATDIKEWRRLRT
jgi:hypothetical protein